MTTGRRSGAISSLALQEENNAPMMMIFGGAFALMLVFLMLIELLSEAAVRERLDQSRDDGLYRIERQDGSSGYVVIAFPGEVRIVETGTGVPPGTICGPGSAFTRYARRVYEGDRSHLVFFVLEGSGSVLAEARNCLRSMWPNRYLTIAWVVADNEFLKAVSLDQVPAYIRRHAEQRP